MAGLTAKSILDKDYTALMELKKEEFIPLAQAVFKAANQRLERRDTSSPAAIKAMESGGTFKVGQNKSLNEWRREFARAARFMGSKTSTAAGTRAYTQNVSDALKAAGVEGRSYEGLSEAEKAEMWQRYQKQAENNPIFKQKQYKYRLISDIINTIDTQDAVDFESKILEQQERIYEQAQEEWLDATEPIPFG